MNIAFFVLPIVVLILYAHVSNNIERYVNSGNLVARSIILVTGIAVGGTAAFLFFKNIAEPSWAFGSGFLLSPLLAVAACVYLVVGALFPLQQVRGLLRYSFRHKLNDDIRS